MSSLPMAARSKLREANTAEEDTKRAALENAFRNLLIGREETPKAIPYEILIPGIVREVMRMGPEPFVDKKKLQKVARSLDSAAAAMGDLLPFPDALKGAALKLRVWHAAAETAVAEAKKSRRKRVHPAKIARFVALHYFRLTGERPTRRNKIDGPAYGPFLELLDTVYGSLGVKASADGVLKSGALNSMEFSQPKSHI